MIAIFNHEGYRIEVTAVAADERRNADVWICGLASDNRPHTETVTCLEVSPMLAEHTGELWARRWVDLRAPSPEAHRGAVVITTRWGYPRC